MAKPIGKLTVEGLIGEKESLVRNTIENDSEAASVLFDWLTTYVENSGGIDEFTDAAKAFVRDRFDHYRQLGSLPY